MKITSALILTVTLALGTASATPDPAELAVAREIKLYIAKEHRARKSNPEVDFAKLHRLCGKAQQWTKGCRLWKATGGKEKFGVQVRPRGKIYWIPSMLM